MKNRIDMSEEMITYSPGYESPISFIKEVVTERAVPNILATRKEYYGRFIMALSDDTSGKLDSPSMFDDMLAAFKRSGADDVEKMQVYVCVVYVEELQPYPFPDSPNSPEAVETIFKIAKNGGIFKSYTFLLNGGTAPEYGDNVVVSFADPSTRKEGIFEYPLIKGAGAVATGGAGGFAGSAGPGAMTQFLGSGGITGGGGGTFSYSSKPFNCKGGSGFNYDRTRKAWASIPKRPTPPKQPATTEEQEKYEKAMEEYRKKFVTASAKTAYAAYQDTKDGIKAKIAAIKAKMAEYEKEQKEKGAASKKPEKNAPKNKSVQKTDKKLEKLTAKLSKAAAKGAAVQGQLAAAQAKFKAAKDSGDRKAAKKAKKEVKRLSDIYNYAKNIQKAMKAPICNSAYPNLATEFPLVLDRRNEVKSKVVNGNASPKGTRHFANFYNRRAMGKAKSRMSKAVMIILHQTAGGRPRNSTVDGVKMGRKAGRYQTAPGKKVRGFAFTTPVHFFLDTFNCSWFYSLENTTGAGDQQLNGYNAGVPAIGIEIMNTAVGVVGSPPRVRKGRKSASSTGGTSARGKSLGTNKRLAVQHKVMTHTTDDAFSRTGPTGTVLPPSQIAALRQTIQFIMSYLQKNYGTRIVYIAQHRSGYSSKPSCPGDYAFRFGVVPVLAKMGLKPIPISAPYQGQLANLVKVTYGGSGAMLQEEIFHNSKYESQFKNIPYKGSLPFTRAVGWNAKNRPLTLPEIQSQLRSGEVNKYKRRKK